MTKSPPTPAEPSSGAQAPSSERRSTAKIITKESIRRAVYAEFNFPTEAAASVVFMLMAFELLLKEENEVDRADAVDLINERPAWDDIQRDAADWVRKKGNAVKHQGRFPPEQKDEVIPRLHRALALIGGLWEALGVTLDEEFSPYERSRLLGVNPSWQDESDTISLAACEYWSLDPEFAFEMANRAFTIGLRAYAASWGIPGAESFELRGLIGKMEDLDDDDIHPSLFVDWLRPDYQFQAFGGDEVHWFNPPMNIDSVVALSKGKWDRQRAAQNYTRLIRDVVLSYPLFLPGAKIGPLPADADLSWS